MWVEGRGGGRGGWLSGGLCAPLWVRHTVRVLHQPQLRLCWTAIRRSRGGPGEWIFFCCSLLSGAVQEKTANGAIPFFNGLSVTCDGPESFVC